VPLEEAAQRFDSAYRFCRRPLTPSPLLMDLFAWLSGILRV
jgi:hypothetical protein